MEPSEQEVAAFARLDDLAEWAGLAHRPEGGDADASPRGTLWRLLGAEAGVRWRVLGAMPQADFEALLAGWLVAGAAPTPAVRSQGGLVGMAARIAAGTQLRLAAVREQMRADAELERARLEAAVVPVAPAESQSSPSGRRVKLATVADQANDNEVSTLSDSEVAEAYKRYQDLTGGPPAPHEELTLEQLTALAALLAAQAPPYVDFSVWGPFGHRIQKKVKLNGLTLSASGELHPVELYGPSDFATWDSCFRVWRTGMLMLGAATLCSLDVYREHVALYTRRYGRETWVVLYQADVRARLEHIERIRRAGESSPPTTDNPRLLLNGLNLDRPWDWCLRELTRDVAFWRRELEEPAILVLARAARLTSVLDGDAPVTGGEQQSPRAPTRRPQPTGPRERPQKVHRLNEDGSALMANRRGPPLCGDFQLGK